MEWLLALSGLRRVPAGTAAVGIDWMQTRSPGKRWLGRLSREGFLVPGGRYIVGHGWPDRASAGRAIPLPPGGANGGRTATASQSPPT